MSKIVHPDAPKFEPKRTNDWQQLSRWKQSALLVGGLVVIIGVVILWVNSGGKLFPRTSSEEEARVLQNYQNEIQASTDRFLKGLEIQQRLLDQRSNQNAAVQNTNSANNSPTLELTNQQKESVRKALEEQGTNVNAASSVDNVNN